LESKKKKVSAYAQKQDPGNKDMSYKPSTARVAAPKDLSDVRSEAIYAQRGCI
jgi:hypothetical protein